MDKVNFVILAAGKGTRMRSAMPKVLHKLAGRSMLGHVVDAVDSLGIAQKTIVTGHGAEQVEAAFQNNTTQFVQQTEQLGTGHAVQQAEPALGDDATVIILYGDVPLIRPKTIAKILDVVSSTTMGLLTIHLDNPQGYGRIVRGNGDVIEAIVEQKDASADELSITEVNTATTELAAEPPACFFLMLLFAARNKPSCRSCSANVINPFSTPFASKKVLSTSIS